jgi:flagellar protein FliO/FliZ
MDTFWVIKTAFALICVLGSAYVILFLFQSLRKKSRFSTQEMNILGGISVGPKERLVLVEVKNKKILIGVTPHHIQKIHVYEES